MGTAIRYLMIVIIGVAAAAASAKAAEEVSFVSADGVTVYGDLYADVTDAPMILLFHQGAGDARGEYAPIVPRLQAEGFNALAIDQRNGGNIFGGHNRTVAALGGDEPGYCEAYPDLEAALTYVREQGFDGPVIVWGSSYSAALAFQLAAKHADQIDGVLAFSPASGEPLADCLPESFSADIEAPLLALRPAREMSVAYVEAQMQRLAADGHETWVADPGVHGSSMLVEERVGASTEATWQRVLAHINKALEQAGHH